MSKIDNKYDVIIIGAGIGGLVCGCYLAKAGMKVLIVERNNKPGGYCVSFKRNGFTFDAGIHALGSCRKGGQIGKILEELELREKLKLIREKVSEAIIVDNRKIFFRSNIKHTIEDLKKIFPSESKNIDKFFNEMVNTDYSALYIKYKNTTLDKLLSYYFSNNKLKFIFSTVIAGNSGLFSYQMAAFAGVVVLREFILDGGYYPLGGMQNFTDTFYHLFVDLGGNILFSSKVEKIKVESNRVTGVVFKNKIFIASKIVISNCDLIETFNKLLNIAKINKSYFDKITKLTPSTALFLVYLGLEKKIKTDSLTCCGLWYSNDIDALDKKTSSRNNKFFGSPLLMAFPSFHDSKLAPPDKESIHLLIRAPFRNKAYWDRNKNHIAYKVIKTAKEIIPDLEKNIKVKEIASPWTFYNSTLNYKGAMRGWASIKTQCRRNLISEETPIENLFLTGHWVTKESGQGGIPMVVRNGRNVARIIKKKYKNFK